MPLPSSPTSTTLLFLFLISAAGVRPNEFTRPFVQDCSRDNFTAESTPQQQSNPIQQTNPTQQSNPNINLLLASLRANITTGYANNTIGSPPDQVFGLALCRGDLSLGACQSCLSRGAADAVSRCPNAKSATMCYEECLIRYSNESFFGAASFSSGYLGNPNNASQPDLFNKLLAKLMDELSRKAAYESPRMLAAGSKNYTDFSQIYGLVQCTRDLPAKECYQCLQMYVGNIPQYFIGPRRGGRIIGVSCYVRYEIYPFYDLSAVAKLDGVAAATPPEKSPAKNPPARQTDGSNTGSSSPTKKILVFVAVPIVVAFTVLAAICCVRRRRRWARLARTRSPADTFISSDSLLFDLATVRAATGNFSEQNKLGAGGFGSVYKGTLENGQQIAVKRLAANSTQGIDQLRNEVELVAKLQHRNLVRLLGCCMEDGEKLLIYEYLTNSSLDKFLFDSEKSKLLHWRQRYKIIEGIARGILYLHEDSRLKIVHRDLKAGNILLDDNMNAKISDFGFAKLFDISATQANTSKIAGTCGYMAPEYVFRGVVSTKLDVYSFGVLILEIVTGRPNDDGSEDNEGIVAFVWRHWRQGTAMMAVDVQVVVDQFSGEEALKCIHIGLLCVQDDPSQRPTMGSIVLMLRNDSTDLPSPTMPTLLAINNSSGTSSNSQSSSHQISNERAAPRKSIREVGSNKQSSITDLSPR